MTTTQFVIQREFRPHVWLDVPDLTYATETEAVKRASLLKWTWAGSIISSLHTIPIRVIKRVTIEELVAEPTKDSES